MTIDTSGNVGVGISPTHKLQVLSTDNKGFYLERNTGNEPASLNEFSSYYSLSIKNRAGGSFLNFGGSAAFSSMQATDGAGSAAAKDIILNPYGGQVGIGTNTPSAHTPLTAYYSADSQFNIGGPQAGISNNVYYNGSCLLYTSDAADE